MNGSALTNTAKKTALLSSVFCHDNVIILSSFFFFFFFFYPVFFGAQFLESLTAYVSPKKILIETTCFASFTRKKERKKEKKKERKKEKEKKERKKERMM